MKLTIKSGVQAAIELLLALPIFIFVIHWGASKEQLIQWLLIVWMSCIAGCLLTPVMSKIPFRVLLALQVIIFLSGSLLIFGFSYIGIMLSIAVLAAFNRGIFFYERSWSSLISPAVFGLSVTLYFVSLIIFFFIPSLNVYLPWIRLFGAITLVITPFAINALLLREESSYYEKSKIAPNVRLFNVFTTSLFAVVVLVIGFSGITQKLEQWIKERISAWLSNFTRMPPVISEPTTGTTDELVQYVEPTWLDRIIMMILYTIGTIIMLVLLYFLLRWVYMMLVKLVLWIKNYRGESQLAVLGYEEEEVMLEWKKLRRKKSYLQKKHDEKWKDLRTNRERIRFLYRQAVWKAAKLGVDFKATLTPSEWARRVHENDHVIPEQTINTLTSSYNRTRYNAEEPDDDTIRRLYNELL